MVTKKELIKKLEKESKECLRLQTECDPHTMINEHYWIGRHVSLIMVLDLLNQLD